MGGPSFLQGQTEQGTQPSLSSQRHQGMGGRLSLSFGNRRALRHSRPLTPLWVRVVCKDLVT